MRVISPLVAVLALTLVHNCAGHLILEERHSNLRASDLKLQSDSGKYTPSGKKKDGVIGGVILGLILWWLVPVCLWNNERIAIKQYKMQLKAERYAVHIDDPEREPLEEMDGRIVYVTGTSTVKEKLEDEKFPDVKAEGVIKLRRIVEMYQWVETEHSDDDDRKTYTYKKEWRDSHQQVSHDDSKRNPRMVMESTSRGNSYRMSAAFSNGSGPECPEAQHANVRLGAYYLGEYVIRELDNWKNKELSAEVLKKRTLESGNTRFMKGDAELDHDGWWYFGSKNDVGDARIRFEELCPGPITIVGVLSKTTTGWGFVPIVRPNAQGAGDSFIAELGASCCFRVKELHYAIADEDPELMKEEDEEFMEDLKQREPELTKKEKGQFKRAQTSTDVKSYNPEEDIEDLCCVGPFGGAVIKLMHWIGLEEEFLGVSEKDEGLHAVMSREGGEAAQRHHLMRVAGWLLLIWASFMIISPVIKLLNFHWLATLMGGGLISIVLICMACACSTGAFCCIVSVSWMAHRPLLAGTGILMGVLMFVGLYMFIYDGEQKAQGSHSLLHLQHYPTSFMALTQAFANPALH